MKRRIVAIAIAAVIVAGGALVLAQSNSAPPAPAPLPASTAYRDYSPEAVSTASEGDKVVLFFHAQWCATCKLLSDDITANVDAIPEDVRILLVDFDTETALKQRYEVTLQHTLVQVNAAGDRIATWHLTPTLDALLDELG
ncbi:MAG: thioredoxin family protein [Cryobacterium sp.]